MEAPPAKRLRTEANLLLTLTDLSEHHFHIGDELLVVVSPFKGQLKVHIRRYARNADGLYKPTMDGVTLFPKTWIALVAKLEGYALNVVDPSFVADRNLLVCVDSDGIQLQQLYRQRSALYQLRPCKVDLDCRNIELLKEQATFIHRDIRTQVLKTALPVAIACRKLQLNFPQQSAETQDCVRDHLIAAIVSDFSQRVNDLFYCDGCVTGRFGQLEHDCILQSLTRKYHDYSERAMTMLDVTSIAFEFCARSQNSLSIVNSELFESISVCDYLDRIEALYTGE